MLTVDYARLGVHPGDKVLDLGCGFGRHAYQAARLDAQVVAFDFGADEVRKVQDTFGATWARGWAPSRATRWPCRSPTTRSTG
jgi:cyclopropane fatty-acyl-phospholipid synthase-like methyltransferase